MMKRAILVAMASLSMVACTTVPTHVVGVPTSPVVVADKTILDEKVGIAVETAYKAFRLAVELAVDSGVLKGDKAAKIAAIDNRAYAFTLATQRAYNAGNSASYISASTEALAAIKDGIAAMKGN